ncbi:MAG: TolC family protein [Porticoccaceae bacterium]
MSYQKKLFQCSLFLLISSYSFGLLSNEYDGYSALSVDQALVLALETHPLIRSAEGQFRAAQSELNGARWSRFPTVSIGAQAFADDQKQQDTTTVDLPLWAGGRINAEIDLAKSRRDGTGFAVSDAQQTVMLETVSTFFEYFKSEKKLTIAIENVDEHQRLYEIIERRVEANTSPDVDAMLALARLQSAMSAEIQSKNRRNISESSLELLIDRPVGSVQVLRQPEKLVIGVDEAVSRAISVSPKIAMVEAEAAGFDASITAARSALYPQVSLGFRYDETHGVSDGLDNQTFISVQFQPGVGLSVASSVTAAKQRKQSALDTLEAEKRDLSRQIKSAWNEYASVSIQLEPSKRLVEATSSVVDSYLRQYAVGKKSWLDVLNAQREATQARNTLVDFEVLYLTSLYRLKILLNEINPKLLGV